MYLEFVVVPNNIQLDLKGTESVVSIFKDEENNDNYSCLGVVKIVLHNVIVVKLI
jgi:hypothetical protein